MFVGHNNLFSDGRIAVAKILDESQDGDDDDGNHDGDLCLHHCLIHQGTFTALAPNNLFPNSRIAVAKILDESLCD